MSHTSRAVTAAMLATARPERDDVISDLAERLTRAIAATRALAIAPAAPEENPTQMSIRMIRCDGIAQGLQEALDYVQEAQMAASHACPSRSSSRPDDALPCLLPGGHDGWHKGLGAVWSGGVPAGPATTAPKEG